MLKKVIWNMVNKLQHNNLMDNGKTMRIRINYLGRNK